MKSAVKKLLYIPAYIIALCFLSSAADEPPLDSLFFTEITTVFPNPERGFYAPRMTNDMWGLSSLRNDNITLVLVELDIKSFVDSDISAAKLNETRNAFQALRDNGLKALFRAAYGYTSNDYYADPKDMNRILGHINQLKPVFEEYKDVLYAVQAGLLGPWGEWHGSNWGDPPSLDARKTVLFALLDAIPGEISVHIRRPMFIRDIFKDEPDGNILTAQTAYSGSRLSRTGWHNDALLSSSNDLGTYVEPGYSREDELNWCGNHGRYTPFGGESCALHDLSQPQNAVYELEKLHADYINIAYLGSVIDRWKTTTYNGENTFDHISRRLGYRFVLQKAYISSMVAPGGRLRLILSLENAGFAAPRLPRDVELILKNGTAILRTTMKTDIRFWGPDTGLITFDKQFRVPRNIQEGNWDVFISLTDPSESLKDNPLYSIRLANQDVWEASTGFNKVMDGLPITSSAPGEVKDDTVFQEIDPVTGFNDYVTHKNIAVLPSVIIMYKNSIILGLPLQGTFSFSIYGLNGKELYSAENIKGIAGKNRYIMKTNTFAGGYYLVKISINGKCSTHKLVALPY